MIEVILFKPYHLELLKAQGPQASQVRTLSHVPANIGRMPGPALTVMNRDQVILCGGILTVSSRMGVLWSVLSDKAGPHMLWLHRAVLRFIDTEPVKRLEASSEKGFDAGCRWLKLLGFEYEGDMRAYGDDGETHERWARVRI